MIAQENTFIDATVSASIAKIGPLLFSAAAASASAAAPAPAPAVLTPAAPGPTPPLAPGFVAFAMAAAIGFPRFVRLRRVIMLEKTTNAAPPKKRPACRRVRVAWSGRGVEGRSFGVEEGGGGRMLGAGLDAG